MVIGTSSTSTIFDVLRTGVTTVMRQSGPPAELLYEARNCSIHVRAADINRRIDSMRIKFPIKPESDKEKLNAAFEDARIPVQLHLENGSCALTLPSFEWRHLKQLERVDAIIEDFVASTLRAQSWRLEVKRFFRSNININLLVEGMREQNASDLHLRAGAPPYIRIDNDLQPLDMGIITADDMHDVVMQLGGQEEADKLEAERESSFQYHSAGVGYLRVSGYFKQGAMALAIRLIPEEPPAFEALDIPEVVRSICRHQRGLFLVCGITGSGKSTTLAAMVDYINATRHAHIITVEDPVEYVYRDKESIISQRAVGRDTYSFANALRGALREDPDVILVGEMRDMETIRAAVSAAETGHLVFSTLHTMTAVDTVNRVISSLRQAERELIRQELAYTLSGVVCQRLLKRKGGGRVPCVELLLGGKPIVRDAILDGEIDKLHDIIEVDSDMKTFDQYAVELYQAGTVEREEAVTACSNEEGFQRIISGIKSSEGRKLLK